MVKDPGLAAATSLMLGADARRSWPPRLAHADASRRLAPRSAARRGISPAARLRPVPEEQARLLIHPGTRQPVEYHQWDCILTGRRRESTGMQR